MRFEKSITNWIIDFMTQIQGLLVEPSQEDCNKIRLYCNVLLISVVSLSGIDYALMKQDLLIESLSMQAKLFPQALAILSDRQDWKHVIPQVFILNFIHTLYKFMTTHNLMIERYFIDSVKKLTNLSYFIILDHGMVKSYENKHYPS